MTLARTICLGFIAIISTGTLLLLCPWSLAEGRWGDPIVALFTATSAVCVTGLAVVDTGTYFSFWGQATIALLSQLGGLGYMMMTTFLMLLLGRKFDLNQKLAIQDAFDRPFHLGSQTLVRSIIATTLMFELAGAIVLFTVFAPQYGPLSGLWLAIFHSVSAWNNAGFSLFPDNLMGYVHSWPVNFAITGLIIFGGIGYQVIIEFYHWIEHLRQGKRRAFTFSLNFKVVTSTTLFLLLFGTLCFWITEFETQPQFESFSFGEKMLGAWFQSVTTRTAGFNTIDNGKMTTAALFITMGLMFIGASPSGTGGGIKTTTFRILANCTRYVLRGQNRVLLYQREVPMPLLLKAVAVVFGSAMTIILGTIIISFTDPERDLIQVLFETISAFATVGLSTGITASLSPLAKLILVGLMYSGRVGVLLLMGAILGDPKPSLVAYPKENLLVG